MIKTKIRFMKKNISFCGSQIGQFENEKLTDDASWVTALLLWCFDLSKAICDSWFLMLPSEAVHVLIANFQKPNGSYLHAKKK